MGLNFADKAYIDRTCKEQVDEAIQESKELNRQNKELGRINTDLLR